MTVVFSDDGKTLYVTRHGKAFEVTAADFASSVKRGPKGEVTVNGGVTTLTKGEARFLAEYL